MTVILLKRSLWSGKTRVHLPSLEHGEGFVRCPASATLEWHASFQQDAQLSQKDWAAGCVSFGQKWKTGTGRQYFTENHCDIVGLQSYRIRWKTQNKGYYAVQGYSRWSRSVPIESPYATSYLWLIVIGILSCTVSELSQLIVHILDTAFLSPPPMLGA